MAVAGLHKKAEAITFEIDSMFEFGAGEEYLARLVTASEDTSEQSKILKDALISDLAQILSLSEQQIQAQARGNQELGQTNRRRHQRQFEGTSRQDCGDRWGDVAG